MNESRVLLTGGTGLVGSHVAEVLAARGAPLRCLVREGSAYGALEAVGAELAFGALDDPAALARAADGCGLVLHVAGATKVRRMGDFMRVNADGTRRLLEAAARAGTVQRFVYVSSLAACGPSAAGRPRVENDPPAPVSAYGRSKLAGEENVRASGVSWVIVRPPAVYGPRDRDVYSFFRMASWGMAPRLGNAQRTVSLIHVKDLARGILGAAEAPAGSVYFLCDPSPYRFDEVLEQIAAALGVGVRRVPVPRWCVWSAATASELAGRVLRRAVIFTRDKARELVHAHWTCDGGKAARELGFVPEFDLAAGIADTAAWYLDHGWLARRR